MLSIILRIAEVTQFIFIEVLTPRVTRHNECDGPRCGLGIKSSVPGRRNDTWLSYHETTGDPAGGGHPGGKLRCTGGIFDVWMDIFHSLVLSSS